MSRHTTFVRFTVLIALVLLLLAAVLGAVAAEHLSAMPPDQWLAKHPDAAVVVNLNTATVEELLQLNGMTEEIATRIVSYRAEFVFYSKPADLLQVAGVTEDLFTAWQPYITV